MKALICFTFNKLFDDYLRELSKHLVANTEVVRSRNKGIPLHMTIWGGLEMDCGSWQERLERAAVLLQPFRGEIPQIRAVEPMQMSMGGYGLRLKFSDNFTMTGNVELNRKICDFVGGEDFNFDQVRHVSLVRVKTVAIRAGREGKVLNDCNRITNDYLRTNRPNLPWTQMTPKIFIKSPTLDRWQEMPLDFLQKYGLKWSYGGLEFCSPIT